jgi:hypothetical protein
MTNQQTLRHNRERLAQLLQDAHGTFGHICG